MKVITRLFQTHTTNLAMVKIMLGVLMLTGLFAEAQTPVAYYPFSGNANDAVGTRNGNVNGATLTTDRFGNANSAYSFDGVDDFIGINHSFGPFTELSVSVWFKLNATSPDLQAIVASNNSGKLFHMQTSTSGTPDHAIYVNGGIGYVSLPFSASPLNQWIQMTITSKSGESKLYINGTLIITDNSMYTNITSAELLRIGSGYLNGRFLNGVIDEVKIYDTALTASQVQTEYNNSNGLIAYYPFTGNANDAIGTNHGTVNGATLTTDRFGNANSACSFNGTANYVEVTDANSIDLNINFTISTWLFPTGPGSEPQEGGIIINKEYSYQIVRFTNGTIQFALSSNGTGNDWNYVNTSIVAPLNTWTHITLVKTGSVVTVYKNGTSEFTDNSQPISLAANTSNLRIGGRTFTPHFFDGKLDEVKIYNTALTAAQVLADYNTSSGLVAHYPFSGNANDAMGTNHGTVNGATLTTDRFGNANSSYSFDGVNDFIQANEMNLGTSDFTLETWILPNVNGSTGNIFTNRTIEPDASGNWYSLVRSSTGTITFELGEAGTPGSYSNFTSSVSTSVGVWSYVVIVRSGVNFTCYINGIAQATFTDTFIRNLTSTSGQNKTTLGSWSVQNAQYFNGKIDEVKIHNTALTASQVQTEYNNSNGLIAYYPFSGNASDAVGSNNGTVNGATLTTDRFGNANSAYSFDGVDDFISTTNLATNQTDNWTMTAWVKPSSISQLNGTIVLNGMDNGITGNGYGMVMGDPSNNANGNLLKGLLSGVVFVNSGLAFNTNNTWYYTAMVREAGITKLYLNGVLSGTTSSAIPNTPSGSLYIGSASGLRFWNGSIDEVKIYNTALTSSQVQAEYNASAPTNTLIAHYPLDGNASDISGNNLHGTIIGSLPGTTDRYGIANGAISFNNNTANRIEVDDNLLLHTPSITLSAWVKLNSLGSIRTFVDKPMGTSVTDSWHFGTENSNFSSWHFDAPTLNPYSQVTSPAGTGQWYYVVSTFDNASKQHKLYVDGVLRTTNTFNSTEMV